MTTKTEEQLIAEIRAAEAAGEDPFGDEDGAGADDAGAAEQDHGDTGGDAGDDSADDGATGAAPADQPQGDDLAAQIDAGQSHQMQAASADDIAAKKVEIRKRRAELKRQWGEGEIDDDKLAEAEGELDEMLVEITTNATIVRLNAEQALRSQQDVLTKLSARAAAEGIDYATPKMARDFDSMLSLVATDDDFKGKPFAALAAEAHRRVAAIHGKTIHAKPAAAKPPQRQPVTLRDLPAASASDPGSDPLAALANLKGAAFERAYERLTPAQRAKLDEEG